MRSTGLRNKVVIVTGAASGIGRATVRGFAEEGARIAAWDVRADVAEDLVHELKEVGAEDAMFQRVDVTETDSVNGAVEDVVGRWARIHVLVNNAGIVRDAQIARHKDGAVQGAMADDVFDTVIEVNLKGVFRSTRAVAPHLIAGGGGVILSASSVVGLYGNFGQTNYVASKAGVIGMTRTWARELGRYNIRVNAVAPGFIATDMVGAMPEKILDTMRQHTPLGRMGRPEEVADAYVWLASDQASFVNGMVLSVDGGLVIGT
jgi:3-oxoacyl-[acyl-carrier protein] reductase